MTRRQLLFTLVFTAGGARLLRAAQDPERDSAVQTVTFIIEGMT